MTGLFYGGETWSVLDKFERMSDVIDGLCNISSYITAKVSLCRQ